MLAMIAVGVVLYVAFVFFALCLCKMAARADTHEQRMMDLRRERLP